ncbi:MAG: phosphatase PAP2 family protein [Candidatus Abyssubacteria bacterium]
MLRNRRLSRNQLAQLVLPSDIINLSFFLLLLLISLVFADRVSNWLVLAFLYSGMLIVGCALIWLYRGNPSARTVIPRRWFPLAFVIIAFFSIGEMVHHVLPYDIDSELIALDYAVFGVHPTVYLSRFLNPYLVDVLQICYASFFFLPVIVGGNLYFRGKMSEFEIFAAGVCLGFYASYIGNLLFPASGPSQTLTALHPFPVEGKWVGSFIREVLFVLEPYRWDCFPSGHVEVTLVTITYCWRFARRLFWWMLPVATGLIISTVWLQYHYVADVVAGAVLAVAVVLVTDRIERAWQRRSQSFEAAVTVPADSGSS